MSDADDLLSHLHKAAYGLTANILKTTVPELINTLLTGVNLSEEAKSQTQLATMIYSTAKVVIEKILGGPDENVPEEVTSAQIEKLAMKTVTYGLSIALSEGLKVTEVENPTILSSGMITIEGCDFDAPSVLYLHRIGYNVLLMHQRTAVDTVPAEPLAEVDTVPAESEDSSDIGW